MVMDGSSGGKQWRCRATVINNGEGSRVGGDGGESSEIFDYSVEPVSPFRGDPLHNGHTRLYARRRPGTNHLGSV